MFNVKRIGHLQSGLSWCLVIAKVGGGSRVGVLTVRKGEKERQQEMEEMEEMDCLSQWIFPEHLQYRNSEIVELKI